MPNRPQTLDPATFREAVRELSLRDTDLARAAATWGPPPFWTHEPGFPGIVISVLAQQVSLESAQAAYTKLARTLPDVSPGPFLALDDASLKDAGFSRQKASYVRGVARAMVSGDLDLRALEALEDAAAREVLVRLRGIGPWTADAYLLFALRRANAWPTGDLALIRAIQEVRRLPKPLSRDEADVEAEAWRPWRGVAARMLWHHYLRSRGRAV